MPPYWSSAAYPMPRPSLFMSIRGVATSVVILLATVAGAAVLYSIALLVQIQAINSFLDNPASQDRLDVLAWTDTFLAAMAGLYVLARIVAAVLFVIWLWRVRENADRLEPGSQRRHKLWVIFGWITPVVAYWFPYQIVKDSWTASASADENPEAGRSLLRWWWIAWVASLTASWITVRLPAETLEEIRSGDTYELWITPIDLAAAALAIAVVRRLTSRQQTRIAEVEAAILSQPRPRTT